MKTWIALCLLVSQACFGQLVYQTDLPTALVMARAQNKWVLASWCRPACTECIQTVRVWNGPVVEPLINANFIPFTSDIDNDKGLWIPYGAGLAGASLPVITVINPNDTAKLYEVRVSGLIAGPFPNYLNAWIRLKGGTTNPPPAQPTIPIISTNSLGVFVTCTNCSAKVFLGKP
jgi:hypothetical protein